jgi:hypothetical protein
MSEQEGTIPSERTRSSKGCTAGRTSQRVPKPSIAELWKYLKYPSSNDFEGESQVFNFLERGTHEGTCRYYGTGAVFGKMLCLIICVDYILLAFLDFFYPREEIDIAPKFTLEHWKEVSLIRPICCLLTDAGMQMCDEKLEE